MLVASFLARACEGRSKQPQNVWVSGVGRGEFSQRRSNPNGGAALDCFASVAMTVQYERDPL